MERRMFKTIITGVILIIVAVVLFKFVKSYGMKTGTWSNDQDQHVGTYHNWAEHNRD